MKELNIIIKIPSDGKPFGENAPESVGISGVATAVCKFMHENGKMYGTYIHLKEDALVEELAEAAKLLVKSAFETERELNRKEETE